MVFACSGQLLKRIFRRLRQLSSMVAVATTLSLLTTVSTFPPPAFAAPGYYTVKQGDSLWVIARRCGTSVAALKQANNLRSEALKPGQVLRIPRPQGTPGQTARARAAARRAPLPARSGDDIHDLLTYARSLLGIRYRWAGESPATGFDCSGFTKHVFGRFGVALPHSAAAQYSCGVPVARAELMPGDLLFFHTSGSGIDHAAIYCGDGRFIHASSCGGCVRVDALTEPYWSSHLVGARRLLEVKR
ncbi:LysM domain-containing protein [Thermodesulfitimonas autotrophica]|uniref:LysM domain-containing protein n=1 Tax=Thermodesulfitimonas autotrophica TaxID=1894989 RepID=A0A3N5BAG8_9THEO|nr:LysM peptidoglycan-binding domain-containing C40 family peptidase [Thermodesulfitimonas autotrophica]RPF42685.1 LysM domain-containing protein [Thermodesulfitimonas autotrophica]